MMNIRTRLYLATLSDDAPRLAREHGLGLEFDEFCTAMNMDADFPRWDRRVREGLPCASRRILHAPFAELSLCAVDPMIREVSMRRLRQSAALCESYGIRRMVVHSGFIPRVYYPEWFVQQGAQFLKELLSELPEDFEILVENVMDETPGPLAELTETVGDPRLGVCLDVGHAHAASPAPVGEWIRVLAPYIRHFHLHDNDGSADLHLLPGDGTIGFPDLFSRLLQDAPQATWTLECTDAQGCVNRLQALRLL